MDDVINLLNMHHRFFFYAKKSPNPSVLLEIRGYFYAVYKGVIPPHPSQSLPFSLLRSPASWLFSRLR